MPDDRLRHDEDDVENLDDLIESRNEGTSHFARDIDSSDTDIDIPEDIDVDEALTFPHPKHKKKLGEDVELMGTPRRDDIDIKWAEHQEDMLPSDYMDDYDDALTTNLEDEDEVAEDQIEVIGHVSEDDLIDEGTLVTPLPRGFNSEDLTINEAAEPSGVGEESSVVLESAEEVPCSDVEEESEESSEEKSIADSFGFCEC